MILAWAALSLGGAAAALAALRIDASHTVEAAEANLRGLWPFWIASASAWAALTALWMILRRSAPSNWSTRGVVVLVGVALAARVAVLIAGDPVLSDDVYRYLFDGKNVAHYVNPYLVTPQQRLEVIGIDGERWSGEESVAARINNPELHTIYLPTSQWAFGATALLIPDARSSPSDGARVFRAVFVLFDAATIAILLIAVRRGGRSPWWAALYAWHPLPLAEIAGSGHQESLGIALLVAALLLGTTAPARTWRWTGCLALASLVKPVVLPVAPLLLKGQRLGAWVRSAAFGAAVCLLVAAPLWLMSAEPLDNLVRTGERFRLKWAHFGSVYEPLLWTIEQARPAWTNDEQEILARRICMALLAAVLVGIWWRAPVRTADRTRARDAWGGAAACFLAMVLLSPAAHPWYLLWALAMVPMATGTAVWVASLTICWGYAAWGYVSPEGEVRWGIPPWLMVAAWGPVYAALIVDLARRRFARRKSGIIGSRDRGDRTET